MSENKTWEQKRMFYIHEQNSGVALIRGNQNLIKRYIKLFNDNKITIDEMFEEIKECIDRSNSGIQKIKESQDYIYNQIKHLK